MQLIFIKGAGKYPTINESLFTIYWTFFGLGLYRQVDKPLCLDFTGVPWRFRHHVNPQMTVSQTCATLTEYLKHKRCIFSILNLVSSINSTLMFVSCMNFCVCSILSFSSVPPPPPLLYRLHPLLSSWVPQMSWLPFLPVKMKYSYSHLISYSLGFRH